MNSDAMNTRLEKLEERSAFQEQAIEDLSQAVTDQWKLIEALKRDISRLTDQLKAVEDAVDHGGQHEPLPPHY